ncbi:MAG: NAD(P)-dependent glycerol-3-phosphate dehydrogenase [Deltaproteobacteria bacterium]|jgi:glycerol-3-phosphate dehydrogenase (NAD(P)+)|nr:NAD(P)-dependent glycerol-3-phosphate dehydrogenase [Deltaproteobacteria bacterium]
MTISKTGPWPSITFPSSPNVAVVGAGAWGIALALVAARQGLKVSLWARNELKAKEMQEQRDNPTLIPVAKLPPSLSISSIPAQVVSAANLIIWAIPSHAFRSAVKNILPLAPLEAVHVTASKGIEDDTFATMTSVLISEAAGPIKVGAISGPSFALEVVEGLPTAVTLASNHREAGLWVQSLLSAPGFRIYTSSDLIGVELGGALKNVYAIAAGISDGLGLGLNARAALITRALNEMIRLSKAAGANPTTLSGLSGAGDLILTCTGNLSRNRQVGLRIGAGEKLEAILSSSKGVAEGVKNAKSVWGLANSLKQSLPMAREVYRVLYEDKSPRQGLVDLLTRRLKEEMPEELKGGQSSD